MLNPIHLIATSADRAGFLRDFKRYTAAQFKANLESTEANVLRLFIDAEGRYSVWKETNASKKIENPAFYRRKLNHIHENPLRKGYVSRPEHWRWASPGFAAPYTKAGRF